MIVIVCGPPHSGKSVFLANLIKQLPTDCTVAIRACPDGEGTWSNNPGQEDITSVRRKGSFTSAFLIRSFYTITNQTADLVLVDVGGVRSRENKSIFIRSREIAKQKKTDCCFIVLSGDKDETQEWIAFGEECGCKCLGVIDSELEGQEEIYPDENGVFRAKITGLKRGTYLPKSKVIQDLSSFLMKRTKRESGKNDKIIKIVSDKTRNSRIIEPEYFEGFMIDGTEMGFELGYGQITPDGGKSVYWEADSIPKIYKYMSSLAVDESSIGINGVRPNFVISAMCKAAKQKGIENIEIFDTNYNGTIPILELPKEEGIDKSGKVEFYVLESSSSIFLDVVIPSGEDIYVDDYLKLVLPKIDSSKKLYISGRLPLWLLSSIVCSYDAAQIHTFQPGKGFTCVASQDESELGKITLIDEVEEIDIRGHFASLKAKSDQQRLKEAEKRKERVENFLDFVDEKEIKTDYSIMNYFCDDDLRENSECYKSNRDRSKEHPGSKNNNNKIKKNHNLYNNKDDGEKI